jgi:hypothetical protein
MMQKHYKFEIAVPVHLRKRRRDSESLSFAKAVVAHQGLS